MGLFKGSSDWCLAKAWRPIQIPSAIYRILMRWVTKQLQSQIEPLLSPLQFCRTGRSTAHGTLEILEALHALPGKQGLVGLLDVSNAFSSVPHGLIRGLLERWCVPTRILALIMDSITGLITPQWSLLPPPCRGATRVSSCGASLHHDH